jgi:hypothetical protein
MRTMSALFVPTMTSHQWQHLQQPRRKFKVNQVLPLRQVPAGQKTNTAQSETIVRTTSPSSTRYSAMTMTSAVLSELQTLAQQHGVKTIEGEDFARAMDQADALGRPITGEDQTQHHAHPVMPHHLMNMM